MSSGRTSVRCVLTRPGFVVKTFSIPIMYIVRSVLPRSSGLRHFMDVVNLHRLKHSTSVTCLPKYLYDVLSELTYTWVSDALTYTDAVLSSFKPRTETELPNIIPLSRRGRSGTVVSRQGSGFVILRKVLRKALDSSDIVWDYVKQLEEAYNHVIDTYQAHGPEEAVKTLLEYSPDILQYLPDKYMKTLYRYIRQLHRTSVVKFIKEMRRV